MKVTVKNESTRIVHNVEMAVGEMGRIVSNDAYKGMIVLRVYGELVSLDSPVDTWNPDDSPNIEIELFPKGTEILLITE